MKKKFFLFSEVVYPNDERQQVTRGPNIIADGWAGVSNPHALPRQQLTLALNYFGKEFSFWLEWEGVLLKICCMEN